MAKKTKTETKTKTKTKTKEEGKVQNTRAQRILEEAKELVKSAEEAQLRTSELLYEVRLNEYFRIEGYQNFSDFAEKSLDISPRRAAYMADVWEMLLSHGDVLNEEALRRIGWSRAGLVASALKEPGENPQEWLEKAETLTVRELAEEVKILKKSVGRSRTPSDTVSSTVKFELAETELNILTDALRTAKDQLDTSSDNEAIAHICMTFLESYGGEDAAIIKLKDMLAYVERTFDVQLSVTDGEEDEDEIEDLTPDEEEEIAEEEDAIAEEESANTEAEEETKEEEPDEEEPDEEEDAGEEDDAVSLTALLGGS